MTSHKYIMEHDEEIRRLEVKTDERSLTEQALWAGLKPGMRVADIGCGPGKTTHHLHRLVLPGGTATGIDASAGRIAHATARYGGDGIEFRHRDFLEPLDDLGLFDFIWVRFVLEYHRTKSYDIVQNLTSILKPGGILCLIDLDYNCLTHFGLSKRLENSLNGIMEILERDADFDPYIGRKLYSFLYDLGFQDIRVNLAAHHLIFGDLKETDAFNWAKKIEIAGRDSGYDFTEYHGGFGEFYEEFRSFFADPRRFTYTPIIWCRGEKGGAQACPGSSSASLAARDLK